MGLYTAADHFVLVPALILALFGCAALLFDVLVFSARSMRRWLSIFSLAGVAFAGIAVYRQWSYLHAQPQALITAFRGSLVLDPFSVAFNLLFLLAAAATLLVSHRWVVMNDENEGDQLGEFTGLVLLAASGMYFLATGVDLITLFVGLELMAVCFYVLVGFHRNDRRSNEAAIKYLLLGAFSSGVLVYGMSLLYGISGSTKFRDIAAAIAARGMQDPIVLLALTTSAAGLLFKVAAFPFHTWTPDAYEGAPAPMAAYLSVGSTAASFAFITRLLTGPFAELRDVWVPVLSAIAVLSLIAGNLAALTQTNLKRLLAYSSISHAGYILLGLIAGNSRGLNGIVVYLFVYALMTLGAFFVIASLQRREEVVETVISGEFADVALTGVGVETAVMPEVAQRTRTRLVGTGDLEDLRGLFKSNPGYAVAMLLFMLSLAGIPPVAGFVGKYYIFQSLIETGHYVLAVIAVLFAVVSLYYYFRLIKNIFMEDAPVGGDVVASRSAGFRIAIGACAAGTLLFGIYPEPLLRLSEVFAR